MTSVTMTATELAEYTNRVLNAGIVLAVEALELKQAEIDRLFQKVVTARSKRRVELVEEKTKRKKGA